MDDTIKLKSRYNIKNYLKRIYNSDGSKSKTYVLKTDISSIRVGYVIKDEYKFIDPSGGPIIRVGRKLEEADAVVKSINFVQGVGWTITFE